MTMTSPLVDAKDYTYGQSAALLRKVKIAGATMEEVLSGDKLLQVVGSDDSSVPYFTRLVSEAEIVSTLSAKMSESEAGQLVENSWKCSVDHFGYHGSPFWLARAGFTLKLHAPKLGPCHQDFHYLQSWDIEGDVPTTDSVVFCPPRLLPNSLGKSVDRQNALLAKLREKFGLPAYFFKSFGDPSTLSGIILTNYRQTGERVPFDKLYARTDARIRGGDRLSLGYFVRDGLLCAYWYWDVDGDDDRGCFAPGVVDLG